MSSGCANSAGSTVTQLRSFTAGRRAKASDPTRSGRVRSAQVDVIVAGGTRGSGGEADNISYPDRVYLSGRSGRGGLVASRAARRKCHWAIEFSRVIFSASGSSSCANLSSLRRLAIIANSDNPQTALEIGDAQAEARKLGLEATITTIRRTDEIGPAIETMKGHADALYVVSDAFATANQVRINACCAHAQRLPTIHANREYVEAGGLIAYGPNFPDLFRRAGRLRR